MEECNLCSPYLSLKANYKATEFIVGKTNSPVWIVGLNPKKLKDAKWHQYDLDRTPQSLADYFSESGVHPYYEDLRSVSPKLHSLLGKNRGVASTDIIKCFSEKYPPVNGNKLAWVISNCRVHLEHQLAALKPKLVICNGADVCKTIKKILPSVEGGETSYLGKFGDYKIRVVLSGFIGRIDNYAKRRLGIEIERYMKELHLDS